MKKFIIYGIFSFVFHSLQGQRLPEFVQQRLDTAKQEARIALDEYRLCGSSRRCEGKLPYANHIHNIFSYEERDRIDSLGLDISMSMIFDDAMRNRIAELMQNKFQGYELDTLVNQHMIWLGDALKYEVLGHCKLDTLPIFQTTLDSLYAEVKNNATEQQRAILEKYDYVEKNKYKMDVFNVLKLDTSVVFKKAYQIAGERERERKRESILANTYYYRSDLAELCGYIGDKRFVQPLIDALEKPDNFNREKVIEALARMRVEPYYSDYVKFRMPRTMEQIKNEWLNFQIDDFVNVLGTQEAYLELSKYLLSDHPYAVDMADGDDYQTSRSFPISRDALYLIQDNIENKDLQAMIKDKNYRDNPEILQLVYDWMQKNYGKYKIKRIW
ncbi:hypothetical protein FACS189426_14400 [Bacteroidia bacterium]|nr:hypothetical protein FACS189426_14400 [Bacteroidia bacterium]